MYIYQFVATYVEENAAATPRTNIRNNAAKSANTTTPA